MREALSSAFDNGIFDTIVLTLLLIMLVLNEVLSGIQLEEVQKLRGMVQLLSIPLGALFLLLVGAHIALLL